ncbi:hypothetical protein XELAEV_18004669mg [Xenopus laevis]|uniref:Uncharacterized protein n=1 Tax=Xenopus laevis TaxID=8355 RepID=A0A974GZH7_XENLA|nr:hypothetical protein XELAEV_18004669mg [Xenopus laevis]
MAWLKIVNIEDQLPTTKGSTAAGRSLSTYLIGRQSPLRSDWPTGFHLPPHSRVPGPIHPCTRGFHAHRHHAVVRMHPIAELQHPIPAVPLRLLTRDLTTGNCQKYNSAAYSHSPLLKRYKTVKRCLQQLASKQLESS